MASRNSKAAVVGAGPAARGGTALHRGRGRGRGAGTSRRPRRASSASSSWHPATPAPFTRWGRCRSASARSTAEAATALRKATELNPSAGGAQNMLGYAALRQGDTAGAIAGISSGHTRISPGGTELARLRSARRCSRPAASRTRRRRSGNRSSCRRSSGQPMKASATPGSTLATGRAGARHSRRVRTRPRAGRTRSRWKMRWLQRRPPSASSRRRSAFSTCSKRRRAHSRPTSPWCRCAGGLVYVDWGRPRQALAPLNAAIANADGGTLPPGLARTLKREGLAAACDGRGRPGRCRRGREGVGGARCRSGGASRTTCSCRARCIKPAP